MKNAIIIQRFVSSFFFIATIALISVMVSCEKTESSEIEQQLNNTVPAEVQAILDKGDYTVTSLEFPDLDIVEERDYELGGEVMQTEDNCRSAGYKTGNVNGGTFYSDVFPCDDQAAKSVAIQSLLTRLGFTPNLCTGDCRGEDDCKPVNLKSPDSDDVELELVTAGDDCFYKATVQDGGGSAKLKSDCNCI